MLFFSAKVAGMFTTFDEQECLHIFAPLSPSEYSCRCCIGHAREFKRAPQQRLFTIEIFIQNKRNK